MKKFIRTALLIGLGAAVLAACTNTKASDAENKNFTAESGDTMVVGLDDTFVPMGFRDNEGNLIGFDVDLAKEAAERMGVEVEFQPIDWAMKETELNSGNIDAIWNGYSMTEERKEKVNFSNPYFESSQVFVVLKDSPIQTWDDLEGKTVASQQSSSTVDLLMDHPTEIVETFADGEIIQYRSYTDVFNDLDSGRSDAIAVSETYARYTMKQKGDDRYRILDESFGQEKTGVGVRKTDTEFLEKLNTALEEMEQDGTLQEIYAKWFAD